MSKSIGAEFYSVKTGIANGINNRRVVVTLESCNIVDEESSKSSEASLEVVDEFVALPRSILNLGPRRRSLLLSVGDCVGTLAISVLPCPST